MSQNITITAEYFRQYRQKLGFGNQTDAKAFFGAKDIIPAVDLNYLKLLNKRLYEIVVRINSVVSNEIKLTELDNFKKERIVRAFEIMRTNGILPVLNNLGRRPEQVYFSWMRGYVVSSFFLKALGIVFEVDIEKINLIGDDDLKSVDTFKKTPRADLEIHLSAKKKIRIEMQSGFTGINDIKQHKVLEAKRFFRDENMPTVAIHIDLYNGQIAFVKLNEIEDGDVNWITRINCDDGVVWNIDQNFFFWNFDSAPPTYQHIAERYYA